MRKQPFNDVSGNAHVQQHFHGSGSVGIGFFAESPLSKAMKVLEKQTRESVPLIALDQARKMTPGTE